VQGEVHFSDVIERRKAGGKGEEDNSEEDGRLESGLD
jgi:hypothetical protein